MPERKRMRDAVDLLRRKRAAESVRNTSLKRNTLLKHKLMLGVMGAVLGAFLQGCSAGKPAWKSSLPTKDSWKLAHFSYRLPSVAAASTADSSQAQTTASAQDKYTLKIPNGLAFSEFRGYESWSVISLSHNGDKLAAILGNPAMIDAYKAGIPENGKPFPDGAKMAKVHWTAKVDASQPGSPTVPGPQHDVDFMLKDSKRFADSGGWGYGAFEYDAATGIFRLANLNDSPPQGNDAKCGFACHTIVKNKDYVFTAYGHR